MRRDHSRRFAARGGELFFQVGFQDSKTLRGMPLCLMMD